MFDWSYASARQALLAEPAMRAKRSQLERLRGAAGSNSSGGKL